MKSFKHLNNLKVDEKKTQTNKFSGDISAISSGVLFALTLVFSQGEAFSNSFDEYSCRICNSGGIAINSDKVNLGQAYMVKDGDDYKFVTIKHSLDSSNGKVRLSMNGCFKSLRVDTKKFECETESNNDASCSYSLDAQQKKFVDDLCRPIFFTRSREHDRLKEGEYLAFVRPKGKVLSVAKIIEINDEYIFLDLRTIKEVDGEEVAFITDAFCEGGSGGPAMIVDSVKDGVVVLLFENEGPVSLGELEFGEKGQFYEGGMGDKREVSLGELGVRGVNCHGIGRVRRPEKKK